MAFFASGRVWERDVVDPIRLSGYREFKWPDGTKYCRAAKQCHPRLACNRDALHRYIGDWHNNLQHGQGVYTFPDGVSIPQDLPSCSCLSSCIPTSWCTKTAVTVQWNPWLDPAPNVPNTSASGMRECHTVRASFCAPCGVLPCQRFLQVTAPEATAMGRASRAIFSLVLARCIALWTRQCRSN